MVELDPKAREFVLGMRELVERTGYTIASCGCCPPVLDRAEHGAREGVDLSSEEMAWQVASVLGIDPPFLRAGSIEERSRPRREMAARVKRWLDDG